MGRAAAVKACCSFCAWVGTNVKHLRALLATHMRCNYVRLIDMILA